ncbi:guanylate kinase [Qaidamihabitans albus]|uniref:guanylate kinase n=1 Tax=Qaidamihabitans albus TaxID=2795733 RepID=UPI0018F2479F|nr:guanylate kinase [Qaidamihabitans albus]
MSEQDNRGSIKAGVCAGRQSGGEPVPGGLARHRLTVVSGPSGVGKSSVVAELRRLCPDVYFSVSVTTRPPRAGEVDGEHYRFVDRETFDSMVAAGEFLEYAEFAGNCYGTPRAPVEAALDSGRPAVLEIELQGARQVRAAMPDARLVMLLPPSWDELVGRLTSRGTERQDAVRSRLAEAQTEIAAAGEFDARVVNDDVQAAARRLLDLVAGETSLLDDSEHNE